MAMNTNLPEVWLRGPVENIPSLLQPAAHAVMQALEEVKAIMQDFPHELLWVKPAGVASVAFTYNTWREYWIACPHMHARKCFLLIK
jgi:hypothetical protein